MCNILMKCYVLAIAIFNSLRTCYIHCWNVDIGMFNLDLQSVKTLYFQSWMPNWLLKKHAPTHVIGRTNIYTGILCTLAPTHVTGILCTHAPTHVISRTNIYTGILCTLAPTHVIGRTNIYTGSIGVAIQQTLWDTYSSLSMLVRVFCE